MRISTVANWLAAVCALVASVVCYQLVLRHVTGLSGPAWFELGCSDKPGGAAAGCTEVLASPYSYFPPKLGKNVPTGLPHIPVAFIGLIYYSALLGWLVGVGRPAYAKRGLHYAAFLLVALGLGGSAYFVWIMFRVISEWCPWCMFTHVLNLLIFICMVFMWPRRRAAGGERTAAEGSAAGDPAERTGGAAHPSARVLMLTLISMVLVNYAHMNMLGLKTWRRTAEQTASNYQKCMSVLERFRGDTEKLFGQWQGGREYEIKFTDQDRIRTYPVSASMVQAPLTPLTVVIYSDFECTGCGKFVQFFEKQVPRMLGGHVRAVFRHFPLSPACNPLAQTNVHPHACEAARLVEGVRLLAGNDGFWKAHDFVFRNQESLSRGTLTPDEVAKAVGVDSAALKERMRSAEIDAVLQHDISEAKLLDVKATPAIYVEGRRVDNLVVTDTRFWERIADWYFERAGVPRPR
ncbi:MAG: vitamin K epoxide reductase family protein [Terrimicrobiaceae bacterium]